MKKLIIIITFFCFKNFCFGQNTVKKVYCLDTNYVNQNIESYYEGCQNKIIDTSFFIKPEFESENTWEIYYDKQLKHKLSDFSIHADTFCYNNYFRNGQKKSVERFLNGTERIFTQFCCENGQLIVSKITNDTIYHVATVYYCNGIKKWQCMFFKGNVWGKDIKWYENGQKQYEKTYLDYNKELASNPKYENKLLDVKYWDENGNTSEPFPTDLVNINMLD